MDAMRTECYAHWDATESEFDEQPISDGYAA